MAAAVMAPLQSLSLSDTIMPPSPVSGTSNTSRHGRSKHGGSVAKSTKGRGRGYSIVDEREVMIAKALTFVLKRAVKEDSEQSEDEEKLVADKDGWVDLEEVLKQEHLSSLEITFEELQSLVASPASKARFSLKPIEEASASTPAADLDESDFLIRLNPNTSSARPDSPTSSTAQKLTPLSADDENLPDLVVYETSYANYPLVLASGSIKRAGGQAYLSFSTAADKPSSGDVSISIHLPTVMSADPAIKWFRNEKGDVVSEGDKDGKIEKKYWLKAVGRRADIGTLFEDGQVKKEIPVGLRGKGAKPKKGKAAGRGLKEMKARSEDESGSE